VRVFDPVEHDMQAAGAGGFFEAGIVLCRSERDHSLMRSARRGSIQLFPRLETHRNAALAANIDELLQARIGGSFGDQNVIERPSGFESLPDGMDSCEQGHYHKGTLMSASEHAAKLAPVPEIVPDIPDKLYFRIGEVARLAGIKPYVLRFWETEFPSLGPRKTGTGHRLYRRKDVELVLEIKRLLYEKRFTIEGARKFLETRGRTEPVRAAKPPKSTKIQGDLFVDSSPLLDAVRKELQEIAKILK
jgi:DNA-binding transcriptional MerR regulator